MFYLSKNTRIINQVHTVPVENAIQILIRDMEKVLQSSNQSENTILVRESKDKLASEQYRIYVSSSEIAIEASDDLGFVYGVLFLSKEYLKIKPFWFWMDQSISTFDQVEIEEKIYTSPAYAVKYRGWFFNDEVLMMKWKFNSNGIDGWKMAFEALLRCGGNMTIPGTDKMSKKNRQLASDMGLWISHHHAEPLGASMFVRAYPDVEPNYFKESDKFIKLWEDAVIEQKDRKVIWNLCFRGQGDAPFWDYDTTGEFDTPKKRGKMISDIICMQADIVRNYVKDPVFCTNLYGEIMELYEQGMITIPEDVIKVRADNGFGKMVTRRRDQHCGRISSMPDPQDAGAQGIYYHVSFYDLQAANHITMLPNSVAFVNRELDQVIENGGTEFWMINCSNVRPHVYFLYAISKKWCGEPIDDQTLSQSFSREYFTDSKEIAACYLAYPNAMISYGPNEDEHCGEQFYTENIRILVHQFFADKTQPAAELRWITKADTLTDQITFLSDLCRKGLPSLESLYQ